MALTAARDLTGDRIVKEAMSEAIDNKRIQSIKHLADLAVNDWAQRGSDAVEARL